MSLQMYHCEKTSKYLTIIVWNLQRTKQNLQTIHTAEGVNALVVCFSQYC